MWHAQSSFYLICFHSSLYGNHHSVFCLYKFVLLNIPCKWNHTIYDVLCLTSSTWHHVLRFLKSVVRQAEQRYFTSQKVVTMAKTRHMRRVLCEPVQSVRDTRGTKSVRQDGMESSFRVKESEVYKNKSRKKKSKTILIKCTKD